MSDNSITEREAVLRERAAFIRGSVWERSFATSCSAEQRAEKLFRLPKVTRPRTEKDPHPEFHQMWKAEDGQLYFSFGGADKGWFLVDEKNRTIYRDSVCWPTPERIRLWADLLDRPTEEVEAAS